MTVVAFKKTSQLGLTFIPKDGTVPVSIAFRTKELLEKFTKNCREQGALEIQEDQEDLFKRALTEGVRGLTKGFKLKR